METVLVAGKIHPAGLAALRRAPQIRVVRCDGDDPTDYLAALPEAAALILRTQPLPAAAIATAARLKVVSRHGVGYDAVDVAALSRAGIPLAVVGDVNSAAVAEHTVYLMLAAIKRGLAADRAVRDGNWRFRDRFESRELQGKTLLLLGFGRIARRVAGLAVAFGMQVTYYDPFVAEIPEVPAARIAALAPALAAADVISVHLPLTADTRHLLDAARLAMVKPGAVLVNTARGGLIDMAALQDALGEGRLAGVGLDVFEPEPPVLPADLCRSERVVFSPHNAALTDECAARTAVAAAANALAGLNGTLASALVVNRDQLPRPMPDRVR